MQRRCGCDCLASPLSPSELGARRGNLRAAELTIKAGLDINLQGDMGCTPLHIARTPEIVAVLLASGASTSIENEFGQAPIGRSGGGR